MVCDLFKARDFASAGGGAFNYITFRAGMALFVSLIIALWFGGGLFRSSGGNGVHLYLLWDEAQDAYSVRMFLKGVLESVGLQDGAKGVRAGQVEVFPRQSEVPINGFGNQAILPLAGKSVPLQLVRGDLV